MSSIRISTAESEDSLFQICMVVAMHKMEWKKIVGNTVRKLHVLGVDTVNV